MNYSPDPMPRQPQKKSLSDFSGQAFPILCSPLFATHIGVYKQTPQYKVERNIYRRCGATTLRWVSRHAPKGQRLEADFLVLFFADFFVLLALLELEAFFFAAMLSPPFMDSKTLPLLSALSMSPQH